MATKMGYHNVEPVNKQQRGQGRVSKIPPQTNVVAAASYIRQLFERKNFNYGIMGGLEMLCLGYRREIPDVHIVFDDKDFIRIKAKLEKDHRVQLPEGMNSLLPSTILVRTGPSYHDIGCTNPVTIEVSLVPSGSYGTPPNGTLNSNLVLLGLKTNGVLKTYKALNMHYLVKTLLYYCKAHDPAWDPRTGIVFLCQHYGAEIHAICGQLDRNAVKQNFLLTAFFTQLPFADQRICYQALLGQEPPPIMAVTPPALQDGHFRSQSASELPRPRIHSCTSTGPLKSQMAPEFLNPLRPGKDKPTQERAANNGSRTETVHNLSKSSMDLSATAKDSRSRYRVVSAPSSRRNNPEVRQTYLDSTSQTRQMAQQTPRSLPSAQLSCAQQSNIDTGTRPRSNFLPSTTSPQLATSPMDSKAHHIAPLAPKSTKGGSLWQPSQRQYQTPAVDLSATYNPGEQHLKPQLGQAGGVIPLHARVQSVPIVKKPVPPQSRIQNPRIPLQTESLNLINSGGQTEEKSSRLQLVGPGGLYLSPHKPQQQPGSVPETGPAPPPIQQQQPVFELDTGANIAASLSADINAAIKTTSSAGQTAVQPSRYTDPTFPDSPLNTPDLHKRASSSDSSSQYSKPARPELMANLRTQSACINTTTLPASLTVGRSAPMRSQELAIPRLAPAPLFSYKAYRPTAAPVLPLVLSASSSQQEFLSCIAPLDIASNGRVPRMRKDGDGDGDGERMQPHKRSVSHESPLTEHSTDAGRLAMEYRAELPDFGRGFSFRYR